MSGNELTCRKDFFFYQSLIVKEIVRMPLVSAAILVFTIMAPLVPGMLGNILNIVSVIFLLRLYCAVVYETWWQLTNEPVPSSAIQMERLTSAWGNCFFYGLAVFAGSLLLLVPGIYFMTVGSLGIVFVCIEKQRAAPAFESSRKLIKGRFWFAFKYLCGPMFADLIIFLGAVLIGTLFEEMKLLLVANIVLVFASCLNTWIQLGLIPMQVRLYKHLKDSSNQVLS